MRGGLGIHYSGKCKVCANAEWKGSEMNPNTKTMGRRHCPVTTATATVQHEAPGLVVVASCNFHQREPGIEG